MLKPYLRSIVRHDGRGRLGFGVELFRLDTADSETLTAEEAEVAEESKEEASATAIMRIYEEIGENFWTGEGVTAKKFAQELEDFGDIKRLNIHINSLGGCAFTAQAIYSILCDHDSKKTSYIDGVAASAATIIACGADEVVARHNTNYMVHYPWAMAIGNADTMRKAADDLEACTVPIVSVYKEQVKGKIDEEKIRGLMEGETWLTADEALEYGFVDTVRGKIKAIAKVGKNQIMCSGRLMDISKYHYRNVPKFPAMKSAGADDEAKKTKQKERTNIMTREEIDPQLLASIQDEAKTGERKRLADLDAMNGPGLAEVITKAKAEGKQPQDISMECFNITRGQLSATQATNALAKDAQAAAAIPAGDAPNVKPREENPEKARVKNLLTKAFDSQRPRMSTNHNTN